jgi:hypothetical protein
MRDGADAAGRAWNAAAGRVMYYRGREITAHSRKD